MKSSFVIAAAALAAGSAFAQGSTEIYGRFNLTAESQKLNGVKDTGPANNLDAILFRTIQDELSGWGRPEASSSVD